MFHGFELPRDEWIRLDGLPIASVLHLVPPDTRIVVVEDASGVIVGSWAVIRYTHVEGVHIAEEHRKRGIVAKKLLDAMRRVARSWGAEVVWTGAQTDEVRRLITHLHGRQLPGDHYVFPVDPCR